MGVAAPQAPVGGWVWDPLKSLCQPIIAPHSDDNHKEDTMYTKLLEYKENEYSHA